VHTIVFVFYRNKLVKNLRKTRLERDGFFSVDKYNKSGRECVNITFKWERVGKSIIMLLGEYTHTIDDKKRLTLPKKFKAALGKKLVITRGLDNCLFIYSEKEWNVIAKRLRELSFAQSDTRGFNRFMFSGAAEVSTDGAGRILVPEHLKKFASLKSKVILAGVADRVEIWDEKRWSTYQSKIESQGDAMAEKLGEIGVL